MQISTLRWAIASFFGGIAGLALASVPLVAYCVGVGSAAFRHALLAALVVTAACLLTVVVALDLLGARASRSQTWGSRPAPSRTRSRFG